MNLPSINLTDDPTIIAVIAREVIRRLRESETQLAPVLEKLVTLETLDRYRGATEIHLARRSIVTAAARDEAARRGIKFRSVSDLNSRSESKPNTEGGNSPLVLTGSTPQSEQQALATQLKRRGVVMPADVLVSWTDQPATEVYQHCSSGRRAVMIHALTDIDRFARELAPNVWILDRKTLNLVAATNAAVRIAGLSRIIATPNLGAGP